MTDRSPIQSLPSTLRLDVLSPASADRIHAQSLAVLERVGIGVPSETVRQALRRAGARVDAATDRVRLPAELVEGAVSAAPRTLELAAREPRDDLRLDGEHGYLAVDGCAAEIVDLDSGARRPSTKTDVADVTRLADALPEIGLVWQPVTARDVPPAVQPLHQLHAQLVSTAKHIQMMTAVTAPVARGVVEIARLVAGGSEALRRRPLVSAFQCSLSPLTYEGGALEAALEYAEAGIPCGFVVMPIACASAPATAGGLLVQSNAEVLAGIAALQLLAPGAATFYGSCATVMDLRSGAAACGGPEDLLLQLASAQLARRYGVPSIIGTFATGAKVPGWQAGLENGLSGLSSCLAGADLLCGAGLLDAARLFSLEQMVMDCEIFGLLRHLLSRDALEPDETIPQVIEAVGPGGHFLGEPHTLREMRRQWMPRLFDRASWEGWEAAGRPGARRAAAERARALLASHSPPPLDDGLEEEILRIIDACARQEGDHG